MRANDITQYKELKIKRNISGVDRSNKNKENTNENHTRTYASNIILDHIQSYLLYRARIKIIQSRVQFPLNTIIKNP